MSEYILDLTAFDSETLDDGLRGEIVRCRDCKYGDEVVWPKSWNVPDDYLDCTGPLVTTWDYYNDKPKSNPVPPDGFCAWAGEKKGLSNEREPSN